MSGTWRPYLLLGITLLAVPSPSAVPVLIPYTVCEIIHDLAAHEGKAIAVVGRYSFRQDGRWISEEACEDTAATPAVLWLMEDGKNGPKPPEDFELDGAMLARKLAEIRKHTALGKFRFGTPDYDRWAVIYGRVETRKPDTAKKAAAELVFRGDGVIIFLPQ